MITRDPMAHWIEPGYVGEAWANRRDVRVTKSGLCIGLLYEPAPRRKSSAEVFAEKILALPRPLDIDARYVAALCVAERRP